MPSTSEQLQQLDTTREDQRIAWLTALAIMIHVVEASLPSLLPGLKPGLANIITISVLCVYGFQTAAWVSVLRVLVGSIIIGSFLTPTFMLSLSGTVCSLLVLWLLSRIPRTGPVGYSIAASLAHMSGQFLMAWLLFIPLPSLWKLYPVLMSVALLLGIINGIISYKLVQRIT